MFDAYLRSAIWLRVAELAPALPALSFHPVKYLVSGAAGVGAERGEARFPEPLSLGTRHVVLEDQRLPGAVQSAANRHAAQSPPRHFKPEKALLLQYFSKQLQRLRRRDFSSFTLSLPILSLPLTLHQMIWYVLAVLKVLVVPLFQNFRNFGIEGDTPEKHGIKSLDL